MPIFEGPNGIRLEFDQEPTQQDLEEAFAMVASKGKAAPQPREVPKAETKKQKSLLDFLGNAVSDVGKIGTGVANFVGDTLNMPADMIRGNVNANPTWSGMDKLARGFGKAMTTQNPLFGGEVNMQDPDVVAAMQAFAPVGESMLNPKGVPGRIAEYAYEAPVSSLLNASMGAGMLAKGAGAAGLGRTAGMLGNVASAIDPVQATLNAVGGIGQKLGTAGMRQAIKPSLSKKMTEATREQVIQSALDNGYTVSERGLRKATRDYGRIGAEIDNQIATAAKNGSMVDLDVALGALEDTREFYKNMPNAQGYLDDLAKYEQSVKSDAVNRFGSTMIPIEDAQKMKQNIYNLHSKHYGEMKGVEVEAEKQLARGIKEQIELAAPQIKELNANSYIMKTVEDEIRKAVARSRNAQGMSFTRLAAPSAAAVGTALLGPGLPVGLAAGAAAYVMQLPRIKSMLAIGLNKAKAAKGISQEAGYVNNLSYQLSKPGMMVQEE